MFPMIQKDVAVTFIKMTAHFSHICVYFHHNMTINRFFVSVYLNSVDNIEHWQLAIAFMIQIGGEDSDGRFP